MLSTDIKHSKSTVLAAATTPVRTDGPLTVEDALALGRALNAELAGHRIPPFCVESSFSLLRGLHKPGIWGALCRGLFENRPCSYWSAIIDHGDLLAMPQALERWGGERLAIGAYVDLPASAVSGSDCCTFLTPNRQAYGQLCELLSWRHEQPQAWSSFIAGGTCPIPCHHLIVLCRTSHWLRRFFACGCEVYMQAGVRPATLPADLHDCDIRIAALPRFRALRRIDHNLLPLLHAIRNGTTCSIRHRDRRPILEHDLTFALPRLGQYFAGFEEQLQCGCELLERCTLFKHHDPDKPKWHVPPAPIHEGDADHRLRQLAEAGIPDRYGDQEPPEVFERLNMECEVIRDTRFAGYILTVYDLAKNRTTCGRGSGASSLICYLLGITNVDPIRYQLVFERFLTRERRDPPDIDIDFPWDERDEVIAKALTRYGQGKAAMVVTHQTMSRKAALREVARAHGLDDGSISSVRDQLRNHHRFGSELHLPEPWPDLLPLARLLTKLPRHCGLHCGGVVITNKPIRHIVPIHPAAKHIKGQPVPALAWEKDGTEQMGLIKIDLLGNRSLAVIRDCLQDLEEDGIRVPRQQWLHPDTDSKTRDLVATGKTMGCFYIESPATRQLQQKAASGDFDRLVVHSSIIRPAAMRYIDRYLERLHEHRRTGVIQEEWFLHPALMNLLSESYGVMSYQEDVMLVCKRLAGFNDQQANKVRKVLGSWGEESEERMAPLRALFYAGCRKRDDIDEETINAIWEMIESFTGYSFCKAHSASYAMVSFQCAFLKAHYPAYFLARVITNEGGFYNASAYCEEARRLGITLLPPCVNESQTGSRASDASHIRLGLQRIRGLGSAAIHRISEARKQRPFRSLSDLRHRAGLEQQQLQTLLDAGAVDSLVPRLSPAQRTWLVAAVCNKVRASHQRHQLHIDFGSESDADPTPPSHLPAIDAQELMCRQYQALDGIVTRQHPLLLHNLPQRSFRCKDISARLVGHVVTVIAQVISRKQTTAHYNNDQNGQPLEQPREEAMSFVTVEDETALLETVWFPESYKRYGPLLSGRRPLRLTGIVDAPFGSVSVHVRHVSEWPAHPLLEGRAH